MDEWRPVAPADEPISERNSLRVDHRFLDLMRHGRDLVHWFGIGRLVTLLVTCPLVGLGAYVLLRAPSAPTEGTIEYATTMPSFPPETSRADAQVGQRPSEKIWVHVAGHVLSPGVYAIRVGERIVDAIRAAGGAQPIADLNAINLASTVKDGDQVYVPAVGEVQLASPVGRVGSKASGVERVFPVNINTAGAAALEELPGIGPSTAAAIIGHRDKIGSFTTTSDLLDVPGIGSAKFEAIKDLVTT